MTSVYIVNTGDDQIHGALNPAYFFTDFDTMDTFMRGVADSVRIKYRDVFVLDCIPQECFEYKVHEYTLDASTGALSFVKQLDYSDVDWYRKHLANKNKNHVVKMPAVGNSNAPPVELESVA